MTTPKFLALIVDDEPLSRKMLTFAFTQEGFACDGAKDGDEANVLFHHHQYDLVVTDLIMPNKNGHSLAVDLLASKSHPVVIIHTSVDDPRITKDLLMRGVDDVVYKPTNYKTLAARATVLVRRRREIHQLADTQRESRSSAEETVNITDIEERMANLSKILPVSQAAFDVYNLTSSDDVQVSQIAAGIARDASLSADVLRLANSAFCRNNPSGKRIIELDEAVLRVGQKRIGELALATSALSAVTSNVLPLDQHGFSVAPAASPPESPSICSFPKATIRESAADYSSVPLCTFLDVSAWACCIPNNISKWSSSASDPTRLSTSRKNESFRLITGRSWVVC